MRKLYLAVHRLLVAPRTKRAFSSAVFMSPQNGKAATSAEAIVCPKDEILRRLQRETTCSSCCSALRVMIQRPLTQLSLLEAFVSHEDSLGYVLKESLASPKPLEVPPPPRPPSAAAPARRARRAPARHADAGRPPPPPAAQDACTKYPLHEWLKNCQPLKRDKRCPMHANSRHIFNSADLWEDMWAEMGTAQKAEICNVNTEELHDKLWQHCTDKHHLCKDCRNNVMWAYDKLTKKDFVPVGTPRNSPRNSPAAGAILRRSAQFSDAALRRSRHRGGAGGGARLAPSVLQRRRLQGGRLDTRAH